MDFPGFSRKLLTSTRSSRTKHVDLMYAMDRINGSVGEGYTAVRSGGDSAALGDEKGQAVREIYDLLG